MGKVRVNLTSGSVVEKPLVTAFKGTNGDYLVLDNETKGSMDYPIICISKYANGIVSKITDPTEWSAVKENLKTIISGTNLTYFDVPENISGDQDFFTQLTLPNPSFELLKKYYAPVPAAPDAPIAPEVAPVEQPAAAPISMDLGMPTMPQTPTVEPAPVAMSEPAPAAPVDVAPAVMPDVPVSPIPDAPTSPVEMAPTAPAIEMPSIEMPTIPEAVTSTPADVPAMPDFGTSTDNSPFTMNIPSMAEPVTNVETPVDTVSVSSNVEPVPVDNTPVVEPKSDIDFSDIKANFMAACENMIDALIEKLKNIK